jgi:exoribonuclease II
VERDRIPANGSFSAAVEALVDASESTLGGMKPIVHHRSELQRVARNAMLERGLQPDFAQVALKQLEAIAGPAVSNGANLRDLRSLLWCSIDNDDSTDLDQLSVSEDLGGGVIKVLVAVADVDALICKSTPLDAHAAQNTATVYVAGHIFPMLPERLSTDLTSLGQDSDRVSLVIEYAVNPDGSLGETKVSRALVRNQAKLAYNAVAAWLDGQGPLPDPAARVQGMDAQLRMQNEAAARLRKLRHAQGALDLQSLEARPIFEGDSVVGLHAEQPNCAKHLIEDFMIAANGVVARFLEKHGRASLRRVVRSPERWAKIVAVAAGYGESLPALPSAKALEGFLTKRHAADPLRFPDLSLVIVKLMGAGEYVMERPGEAPVGHFGLAVRDYAHSTAPNRRFPDLVTHRLVKAALAERPAPYSESDLSTIAAHCTVQEANVAKVERQVRKSAAALLLEQRLGQVFEGVITGAADKGTWVRVFDPPVEGRVAAGRRTLRVGDKLRVRLIHTDFERGFIDFEATH